MPAYNMPQHYIDVIMTTVASQITSLTVVYSIVYSDPDQRKHQSSASLAIVRGIHRDRWIPRTKGQLRGKCFHLMTSSWNGSITLSIMCITWKNLRPEVRLSSLMMTSSKRIIFRVTGPLCGEFTGHRWIPLTKPSEAGLWSFLYLCLNKRLSKPSWGWWLETLSCPLRRHSNVLCISTSGHMVSQCIPLLILRSQRPWTNTSSNHQGARRNGFQYIWRTSEAYGRFAGIFRILLM